MGLFDSISSSQGPSPSATRIRDGPVQRFKDGILGDKWHENYLALFSDSTLAWYNDRNDHRPAGSVLLRNVAPFMCVGPMVRKMPVSRPPLPYGASENHLVAIGMDAKPSRVHWFLFSSDNDLEAWFEAIVSTLPPRGAPGVPPVAPGQPGYIGGGAVPYGGPPPPYGMPQGGNYQGPGAPYGAQGGQYPQGGYSPYGGAPAAGGYPQEPQPTTVVTGRDPNDHTKRNMALGIGGGVLGGALLGYGIGEVFHHFEDNDRQEVVENNETVNNYYTDGNNAMPGGPGGDGFPGDNPIGDGANSGWGNDNFGGGNDNFGGGYDDFGGGF